MQLLDPSKIPHFLLNEIKQKEKTFITTTTITAECLMECAGLQCARFLIQYLPQTTIHIICGKGNNGADGLTIARHLKLAKKNVIVYLINNQSQFLGLAKKQLTRCKKLNIPIKKITTLTKNIKANDLLIEALMGIGLKNNLSTEKTAIIEALNTLTAFKCSIDIPCGCFDDMNIQRSVFFKPNITLSLGYPKQLFQQFPYSFGTIYLINISLPDFIEPNLFEIKINY